MGNTIGPRNAPSPATPALPTPEARGWGVPTALLPWPKSPRPPRVPPKCLSAPGDSRFESTRFQVRILTPPLFFVLFLLSDGRSGALSGETESNHKKATPVANFRRRLQNFRRGGLW